MEFKSLSFPYKYFDTFVEKFLINHQSIFSDKEIEQSPEILLKEYAKLYWELSNADKNQVKFDELLEKLGSTLKDTTNKEILNHAIWLWGYPNNRKSVPIEIDGVNYKKEFFVSSGVASAGAGYVQYKTRGVLYCLYLINSCWITDKSNVLSKNISEEIKKIILNDIKDKGKNETEGSEEKYDNEGKKWTYKIEENEDKEYTTPKLVCNLLLHIVDHDYEPIATDRDKELIRENFEFLLENGITNDVNHDLKEIRNKLKKYRLLYDNETFYNNKNHLDLIWRSFSNSDLPLTDMLRIKKAVILYGPPGTGKTYTAREIAKQLYIQTKLKKDIKNSQSKDALNVFEKFYNINKGNNKEEGNNNEETKSEEYISVLQFHINYNYEDFMVGQTIDENEIVIKPGFIFDVIKKANSDKNTPYVVILDEINRTDISRVFGELFSAMEYRNKPITLPYKVVEGKEPTGYEEFFKDGQMFLKIPKNLYFIGTMNEIDFSLERVDFALRRRFLWEYAGYNENALQEMLESVMFKCECEDKSKYIKLNEDISDYIQSCTNLNEVISNDPNLGKKYEIGHAFFNISEELWEQAGEKINTAKKILWQISIKPTLEAYCGSMDEQSQVALVQKCEDAFKNKDAKNGK